MSALPSEEGKSFCHNCQHSDGDGAGYGGEGKVLGPGDTQPPAETAEHHPLHNSRNHGADAGQDQLVHMEKQVT